MLHHLHVRKARKRGLGRQLRKKYFISMPFLLIAVGFPRRKKKRSLDSAETLIYLQRIINGVGLRLWYGPSARFDATVRIQRRGKTNKLTHTHAHTHACSSSSCHKKNSRHSCITNKSKAKHANAQGNINSVVVQTHNQHIAKTSQGSTGLMWWYKTDYWHVISLFISTFKCKTGALKVSVQLQISQY